MIQKYSWCSALCVAAALCAPGYAGTAVYTGNGDAAQISDANVTYGANALTIVGGPTADPAPRGELVDATLPGGLSGLAPADVLFEMVFTAGQTPATNASEASAPSGVNCGIEIAFSSGGSLAMAWGASFNVYTVAAVVFPATGNAVVAQAASPVTTDLRAIRFVRNGDVVRLEYDTASGTTVLGSVDLTDAGSSSLDLSADTVTYKVVSANTFGSLSNNFAVDEVKVCGDNIPTVNNGTGPCDLGNEGEGEGEGEGECPTSLSAGCPDFDAEGVGYFALLDSFIPGPPVTWAASDLTQNGLVDSWEVALFNAVLCGNGPHAAEAICAYEANLLTAATEPALQGGPFPAFKKVIVALQSFSSESQAAQASLGLQGDYRIAGSGAKAIGEPFAAEGDLDGDGLTNEEEYDNVIANGGTLDDYIAAATNPLLDGTLPASSLPVGGAMGLATAFAALGTLAAKRLRK